MNEREFKKQMLGEFKVDERTLELERRLTDYYTKTMHMSDAGSFQEWRKFSEWAKWIYSLDEINRAKRSVQIRLNL